MSDVNTPLPFEGDPVVEQAGTGGSSIDVGQDTEIDAAGDGADEIGERTADEGRISADANDQPTDAAPATQDSAAGDTNGLP